MTVDDGQIPCSRDPDDFATGYYHADVYFVGNGEEIPNSATVESNAVNLGDGGDHMF